MAVGPDDYRRPTYGPSAPLPPGRPLPWWVTSATSSVAPAPQPQLGGGVRGARRSHTPLSRAEGLGAVPGTGFSGGDFNDVEFNDIEVEAFRRALAPRRPVLTPERRGIF